MPETEDRKELRGNVEDVTFRREDNGFTVLELMSEGELVTVVGVLPRINAGEELRLLGTWDHHPSFGRQFKAELCEHKLPATSADLLKYLSSGAVKGIGPVTAVKIVEAFGENTFDVLENDPVRLSKIKGISPAKAKNISAEFKAQFAVREVMIALERFGMTYSECLGAYKAFGASSVETITRNPYLLCGELIGVGFERADQIAAALPEPPMESYRLFAGILHILRHNLSNGHTCIPREKMYAPCYELLGSGMENTDAALNTLTAQRQIIAKTIEGREFLFLPNIYLAEKNAADRIAVILRFPPAGRAALDKDIEKVETARGIRYEDKQREAIVTAVKKGILILTGGPGTGKTTTINAILKLFESDGLDVTLAAPTGRAAKRMSEVTGREAKTIHRLLECEWDANDRAVFNRNARNPLSSNAVIVDELSMVDISLFSSLLEALPLGCRLVMVGDSDQLPPVGAGNVLHDLIASGLLPVVELKEIFRQAMESLIVMNAHRIVRGEMPELRRKDKDFFFIQRASAYEAAGLVGELCSKRLPAAYGYDAFRDIQVLCPSRKGEAGTKNLNKLLQERLNPPHKSKKEAVFRNGALREGDKVMQIKNNYDIVWTKGDENGAGVFNGDIGIVTRIDTAGQTMTIEFDEREVSYPFEEAAELELAYAVTVHKSQGNEFEAVVMPAVGVSGRLAYRNLLYTAVTRAKKLMVIVGARSQIQAMVENDRQTKRYSALRAFLTEAM